MGRRPLLVIAGWLGAAALALIVALAATNVIGNGLTSSAGEPMSAAEVARQLAAAPPPSAPPTATPTPTLTPSPSSAGQARVRRTLATDGGLIVATCSGSLVTIETMSPAQGYTVHERDREPRRQAEAEFRSVSDDQDRVKVEVRCVSGVPTLGVHD